MSEHSFFIQQCSLSSCPCRAHAAGWVAGQISPRGRYSRKGTSYFITTVKSAPKEKYRELQE